MRTSASRSLLALAATGMMGCVGTLEGQDPSADDIPEEKYASACVGAGIATPDRGFGMKVALTFDDGLADAYTPSVMATLRRRGVPATFFVQGNSLASAAGMALGREIAADPLFILANHTWNHPNMCDVDSATTTSQINNTAAKIAEAGETARYIRFPYGNAGSTARSVASAGGSRVVGWDVDSNDWCYAAYGSCSLSGESYENDMNGYILDQAIRKGGGIILLHSIHANTSAKLDSIISDLIDAGFSFTNLDDVSVFPYLNGTTPTTPPAPAPAPVACGQDICDYSWCGKSAEGNCPDRWKGTNDGCDCGCQWFDPDCGVADDDPPPAPAPTGGTFAGVYCTNPGGWCGGNDPCWPATDCPGGSACDWSQGTWGRCMQ